MLVLVWRSLILYLRMIVQRECGEPFVYIFPVSVKDIANTVERTRISHIGSIQSR